MLSKGSFIFIEYNGVPYPEGFSAQIHEVAGHLDKDTIEATEKYPFILNTVTGKENLIQGI